MRVKNRIFLVFTARGGGGGPRPENPGGWAEFSRQAGVKKFRASRPTALTPPPWGGRWSWLRPYGGGG